MGLKLMKIELCSEDRLKITLKYEDLRALSLSFDDLDYAQMETRRVIWELLDEAGKILLKGQSIGNGGSFDFSQTGIIAKDAAGNFGPVFRKSLTVRLDGASPVSELTGSARPASRPLAARPLVQQLVNKLR